jgi:phospholipid/cholesterol/gamma-HCH transport system substrate-binding protein
MRRGPVRRTVLAAAATVLAAVTIAACGSSGGFQGIYSLPLPGGANLGPHPYTVRAVFANVIDLVPQASVEVNNVAVGRVTSLAVPAGSWNAVVTMTIRGSVKLPGNAIAQLEQSSLFGSEFVALGPLPGVTARGRLADNATIPLDRTTTNVTVEAVLGALSMLLNGGGLAQLHTIEQQVTAATNGNIPQIRSVLTQINTLAVNLNAHRSDITAALDGLNQLSQKLSASDQQIGYVLDNLSPGLKVFTSQIGQLQTMLNSLHQLSTVAVSTINASAAQTTADLTALDPVIRNLANAGSALPNALQVLFTYPFTDQVTKGIGNSDYLNAFLTVTAQPGTCVYAPLVPGDNSVPTTSPGLLTCPPQP